MMTRILTKRIFLRRVALITSRSRSSCAHPSALRKEKLHVCEACDDSNPSDEVVPQKIRPSKPLCIDIKPSKEKIREVDYIKVAPRVTRSEPSAEEVPKDPSSSTSRKRLIEVTDAPTEKTRPTEVLATRTGKDYARIYPRASQPESQEEAAPDQTKKAVPQSEYVTSLVISASYQLRSLFWSF